nr:MAG TPA: hypothetical protein [Caudoviricetes sp.]
MTSSASTPTNKRAVAPTDYRPHNQSHIKRE